MTDAGQMQVARRHADTGATGQPRISVIMANFNGALHLRQAIRSVLDQTHQNIELIISDDGSSDDSRQIVHEALSADPRVRLIEAPNPGGPAAARNRALAVATGDWVAIIDSDDLIHPERLARMLQSAQVLDADLVADDMIFFGDDPQLRHGTLLEGSALQGPAEIDAVTLVLGRIGGGAEVSLGYLKPMIRHRALGQLRYDETLRIDEDHDLYLRLLLAGARFWVIPDAMYLYRRHALSASHRFSVESLKQILGAQAALVQRLPPDRADLARAIRQRMQGHVQALSFLHALEALKARNWLVAAGRLLRNPRNILSLLRSLKERAARRFGRRQKVRTGLKLVLSPRGQAVPAAYAACAVLEVPEVPATGWAPSAARTWAELARLASRHDLDIVAVDGPGRHALGLVPRFASAQVILTRQTADATSARPRAADWHLGAPAGAEEA